jgi:hypothetical protein
VRFRFVAVAALVGSAAADSSPPVKAPASADALAVVSYEITPGKPIELAHPDQPAEFILATRDVRGGEIVVNRNVGKTFQAGAARLTPEEWSAIERVVKEHKLLAWRASPTGNQHWDDYSTSSFSIVRAAADGGNVQHWSQPVAEIEQPQALAKVLARLARAKVPGVPLHYLVP